MKLGFSLKAFEREPLPRALEHLAALGFDGVELRAHESQLPPTASPARVGELRSMLRAHGLAVSCLATFTGDYSRRDESGCAEAFADLRRSVEHAVTLECPLVRHWAGWEPSHTVAPDAYARSVRWMRRAAEHAAGSGVVVGLEIHHGTLIDRPDAIERYLADVDHPAVGLIYDAANMYHDGTDHGRDTVVRLGARITTVHFKDVVALLDDSHPQAFAYQGRWFCHRPLGEGGVDHWSIARGLREIGYAGFATIESDGVMSDPYELARHEVAVLRDIVG